MTSIPTGLAVVRSADPAAAAANAIAELIGRVLANRPRATLALSGGSSPLLMFDVLAGSDVDWDRVDIVQVDERVAPDGDPARNATALLARLVGPAGIPEANVHLIDVEGLSPEEAAVDYAQRLRQITDTKLPVIDVVHLGLGADGHTASLVPEDPVLEVRDRDVAATGVYQGHRRITMTFPLLNRANARVWLAASTDKSDAVDALIADAFGAPAALVRRVGSTLVTDLRSALRF